MTTITKRVFDKFNGKDVIAYRMTEGNLSVEICDLGCRINDISIGGVAIARRFTSVSEYIASQSYAGATVGRVANRIEGAKIVLDGRPYFLSRNEGQNHLHGGLVGFDMRLFSVRERGDALQFELLSEDGDQGYPGALLLTVTCTLKEGVFRMDYKAVTSKTTLFAPTNHTYFNLDGVGTGDCLQNVLTLYGEKYTATDSNLITTGEVCSVYGTPLDFTQPKTIGRDYNSPFLKGKGYDHNYLAMTEHMAHAESSDGKRSLDVYSNLPCMQLYSWGDVHGAFCVEPQFVPNAINRPQFTAPILRVGEEANYYISFKIQ